MRFTKLFAVVVLAGSTFAPQAGATPPPDPHTCTATLEGAVVPANPAGLIQTAAIVVAAGEVVCLRDVLNSTPNETLSTYSGHITIAIVTDQGDLLCDKGPVVANSVGPVLVNAIDIECIVPVTDPRRTRPLKAVLHWATLSPYWCCDSIETPLSPVGVAAQV